MQESLQQRFLATSDAELLEKLEAYSEEMKQFSKRNDKVGYKDYE